MTQCAADDLYRRASQVLPGGVSRARQNAALGHPLFVQRAEGPFLFEHDGRRLIDLCMSNGATLLGHGHPAVSAAVARALDIGVACAYESEEAVTLAERLVAAIPSFEMVRFTMWGLKPLPMPCVSRAPIPIGRA